MARIRTIKPEFPHSESMGRVSREARLTFILLWTLADDAGKLRGSSRMLASLLFPYDNDAAKKIGGWLSELEGQRCILPYEIDGTHYIRIEQWHSHQKVDRPSASKIPNPPDGLENAREDSRNIVVGSKDQGSKDQGPLPRAKVSLEELSVDHIRDWLADKRTNGRYVNHDEQFILEYFKNYCASKNKKFTDYVAAYRNAFEWQACQPKPKGDTHETPRRQSAPGPTKDERARAAVMRAAERGGFAPRQQPGGKPATGDTPVS